MRRTTTGPHPQNVPTTRYRRATYSYTYTVPERAGPGPMDPSSVMWMYHSHVDEVGDTDSGLIGPVIVTARNKARAPTGHPRTSTGSW